MWYFQQEKKFIHTTVSFTESALIKSGFRVSSKNLRDYRKQIMHAGMTSFATVLAWYII